MTRVSTYDEVAFPSYPFPATHPTHLAAIAELCGLHTPAVENCRILELGCGAGGNLLPIADALPSSDCLGIDLSPQQIQQAANWQQQAGLTNVRFDARDILTLDFPADHFDYIVVHGLYSWTTDEVRERILATIARSLAPNGIAYVNYNTYPGWHLQGMLRDMVAFPGQQIADPAERVLAARKTIEFLKHTLPSASTPYGALLRTELDAIAGSSDAFLFHAYLNVVNQPYYFSAFQQRAAEHGLRVLGDAEPALTWPDQLSPALTNSLRQFTNDTSQWPQLYDFVNSTASRRSLLCREALPAPPTPQLPALDQLHLSARLQRSTIPGGNFVFVAPSGKQATPARPQLATALQSLADAWPHSLPFSELEKVSLAGERPASTASLTETASLRQELLQCFCHQILDITATPFPGVKVPGERPQAGSFARVQAAHLDFVTNLRHQPVRLSAELRSCLKLLDGTRNREQLAQELGRDPSPLLQQLAIESLLQA